MLVQNPILRGFHPDASVVKAGDGYYLATSTFEWWPGIDIYYSQDLINWQLVDQPLQRTSQANLLGNYNSGSIWAPHLSYSEGKFWLLYTDVKTATAFKDTLNYVISCETVGGEWSDPVFVTASGFDPAFFHDEDGRHYILSMLFDHRLDRPGFSGLVMQEIDLDSLTLIGQRSHFFTGTDLGVCEGPQLLKKDGWYYLICAAGGTGYSHAATVCRSRQVFGPYEQSPYHPFLTSKTDPTNPLQKSGHVSFIEVSEDDWYIVHICARPLTQRGNCVLGRETALQKICWIEGWPQLENGTMFPELVVDVPQAAAVKPQQLDFSTHCSFSADKLPTYFKTLRRPLGNKLSLTERPGYLRLYGEQSLSSLHQQTLVARRWQHPKFTAETQLEFSPKSFQQLAGLVLFYDTENWYYLYLSFDEEQQQRFLQVEAANANQFTYVSVPVPIGDGPVMLSVEVNGDTGQFFYQQTGSRQEIGESFGADKLSDDYIKSHGKLAFTGAMVGLCTQDMDDHSSYADFAYFHYQEDHTT